MKRQNVINLRCGFYIYEVKKARGVCLKLLLSLVYITNVTFDYK